jgi:hypothetical protein
VSQLDELARDGEGEQTKVEYVGSGDEQAEAESVNPARLDGGDKRVEEDLCKKFSHF